jgi:hypothetical protein
MHQVLPDASAEKSDFIGVIDNDGKRFWLASFEGGNGLQING